MTVWPLRQTLPEITKAEMFGSRKGRPLPRGHNCKIAKKKTIVTILCHGEHVKPLFSFDVYTSLTAITGSQNNKKSASSFTKGLLIVVWQVLSIPPLAMAGEVPQHFVVLDLVVNKVSTTTTWTYAWEQDVNNCSNFILKQKYNKGIGKHYLLLN